MDAREERLIAGFETEGAESVRLQLFTGVKYSPGDAIVAARWLGKHDQDRLAESAASNSEQIRLVRSSNEMDLAASRMLKLQSKVAIATLIVAIIGSAAAIAGLFMH
jgi:hypothetical protein